MLWSTAIKPKREGKEKKNSQCRTPLRCTTSGAGAATGGWNQDTRASVFLWGCEAKKKEETHNVTLSSPTVHLFCCHGKEMFKYHRWFLRILTDQTQCFVKAIAFAVHSLTQTRWLKQTSTEMFTGKQQDEVESGTKKSRRRRPAGHLKCESHSNWESLVSRKGGRCFAQGRETLTALEQHLTGDSLDETDDGQATKTPALKNVRFSVHLKNK